MKTVYKPWGKELWLELNDKYCYKRIHINWNKNELSISRTKIRNKLYHRRNFEVWLENDEGVVEKEDNEFGEFFTVRPPKKHRVMIGTDIILQEVSTLRLMM